MNLMDVIFPEEELSGRNADVYGKQHLADNIYAELTGKDTFTLTYSPLKALLNGAAVTSMQTCVLNGAKVHETCWLGN